MSNTERFYISTPIYYVNDQPHIGHVYTTTVADIVARYHRLLGQDVFFLTGVDEHATKVVDAAAERGLTAQQWADRNARAFEDTFNRLGMSNNDFIRTSQNRHKTRVQRYVQALLESGDVFLGDYEGWYDAGQEEYIPDNKAKEYDFKSPFNGKPLVRRRENNYFFRLSKYQQPLLSWLEANPLAVQPDARRNEVIARIREGLNDVPISRTGADGWGIPFPGEPEHTIYVWIDALANYLTTVDTDERRHYWPADVHLIAKDILWFHAVIWPAVLMALHDRPGYEWVQPPRRVYCHSFWISEGQKMSKSLGNFIDLAKLDHYVSQFGLDVLRYFFAAGGPIGVTDSDFAESRFIDIYNADLANCFGNCTSRVASMTSKYFGGKLPAAEAHVAESDGYGATAKDCVTRYREAMDRLQLDKACAAALDLVRAVDSYIEKTQPFKLAKDPAKKPQVATILYHCAEALRIASVLLWPIMPGKVESFWCRIDCQVYAEALSNQGRGRFEQWVRWGELAPGTPIIAAEPLFPRHLVEK